jgi:hypothetical protein
MAVENKSSVLITNANAGVKSTALIDRANLQSACGTLEVAADGSANSVYRFARIPSQANINSILIYNDALTGGTSYSVGVYDSIEDGGPATDAAGVTTNSVAFFASAVDMTTARTVPLDVRFAVQDINTIGKSLAELLGFTTGGGEAYYDIVITAVTPATAAGTLSMEVRYSGF